MKKRAWKGGVGSALLRAHIHTRIRGDTRRDSTRKDKQRTADVLEHVGHGGKVLVQQGAAAVVHAPVAHMVACATRRTMKKGILLIEDGGGTLAATAGCGAPRTGHERPARRGADGVAGVRVGKLHPLARQAVDVGRLQPAGKGRGG